MSREVRRVPAYWFHPHNKPLLQKEYKDVLSDYDKDIEEWKTGKEQWKQGLQWCYETKKWQPIQEKYKMYTWEEFAGKLPILYGPEYYMSFGEWYQLYETISEGLPLSPSFETSDELINYLINN